MRPGRTLFRMALLLAGVVLVAALWYGLWWYGRPTVAVNYVSRFNQARTAVEPATGDDGTSLFMAASTAATFPPQFLNPDVRASDLSYAQADEVREWLNGNSAAFDLLARALQKKQICLRPEWRQWPIAHFYFPSTASVGKLQDLLIWRGKMKAMDGDARGGIVDVLAAAGIGQRLGERLTWDEWRQGAAGTANSCKAVSEIVRSARLTEPELADLGRRVEQLSEQWEDIKWPLEFQKMTFLDLVQRSFTDDGDGDGRMIPAAMAGMSLGQGALDVAVMAAYHPGRKATLESYDRAVQRFHEQWGKRSSAEAALMASAGNEFVRLNLPASDKERFLLSLKRNEVARTLVTVGVLRYQAATGHLPVSLAQVVEKGYLKEVPRCWYSNEEAVYETADDSFVVYISESERQHAGWVEQQTPARPHQI
jgi:hypothetical protein